jgi:Fic family protein
VRGLTSYRYTSGNDWIDFFSSALIHAADSSELLAQQVAELKEWWLEAAGRPRARSAPRRLIEAIPTHPVLTLATARSITSLSDEACRRALNRLEQSGVLRETTAGKRNRVWESVGLFDLLDRLERAVGDGPRAPARTN